MWEFVLCVICSLMFALIIAGWGLVGTKGEEKQKAKNLFWIVFFVALAVSIYGSGFWKSDLWK